jgi:hypothetical protein
MERNGTRLIQCCRTCHTAKSHILKLGLYTSLLVVKAYWKDVSMIFMLGLPRSSRNKDSIMVVVDHFPEMTSFFHVAKYLML